MWLIYRRNYDRFSALIPGVDWLQVLERTSFVLTAVFVFGLAAVAAKHLPVCRQIYSR